MNSIKPKKTTEVEINKRAARRKTFGKLRRYSKMLGWRRQTRCNFGIIQEAGGTEAKTGLKCLRMCTECAGRKMIIKYQ
jgi:hypothetical protein